MPTRCRVSGTLRAMLGWVRWCAARITRANRYIDISRFSSSRTRSRATFPASSKNRRDSMWLEFITAPVNILSNAALISHQTRDRSLLLAYSPPMCMKHRSNCDFAPASRDPRHRGLSVFNGEARTLDTTKFFELFDALVASLQSRKTLHQSSDLAALF